MSDNWPLCFAGGLLGSLNRTEAVVEQRFICVATQAPCTLHRKRFWHCCWMIGSDSAHLGFFWRLIGSLPGFYLCLCSLAGCLLWDDPSVTCTQRLKLIPMSNGFQSTGMFQQYKKSSECHTGRKHRWETGCFKNREQNNKNKTKIESSPNL